MLYIAIQKFGVCKIVNDVERNILCSPSLQDLVKNKYTKM